MTSLSAEATEELLAACARQADRRGRAVGIAVADAAGTVIYQRRPPEVRLLVVQLATAKAATAALMRRPTSELAAWQERKPVLFMQLSQVNRYPMVAEPGGRPIWHAGELIGGLGVAGSWDEQDEDICVQALAEAGFDGTPVP